MFVTLTINLYTFPVPDAAGNVRVTSAFPPTSPNNKVLPACSTSVMASVAVKVCIAGLKEPVKVVVPVTPSVPPTVALFVIAVVPVAVIVAVPEDEIVKLVPVSYTHLRAHET